MDEVDVLDAALLDLQPTPAADDELRDEMLRQRDLIEDELLSPSELKVDNTTCATASALPVELVKNSAADSVTPVMKSSTVKSGVTSSLLRRLLRYSLPLPLLLVILFGGLYLLCGHWNEALHDLGLLINPQLKHVRGPPPV